MRFYRDLSPVDFSTASRKATTIPGLSPAHVAFGDAIRAIRKEQGISQEAFALKCELDRSYFGAVERGERNVSLTNILRAPNKKRFWDAAVVDGVHGETSGQ